jgi:hypothetical protein
MIHTIVINDIKSAFKVFRILIDNRYKCYMRTKIEYVNGNSGTFYTIFIIEYQEQ